MAITTDSYFDVINGGITVDRIGLSKTLNNYTVADLKTMTFCGMQNKLIKNVSERINANLVDYTTLSQPTPFNAEQTAVIGNGGKYSLSEGTGTYNFPDGLPVSIMWLVFPSGTTPHRMLRNTDTQVNGCKIITEFDAPKYEYEIVDPVQVQGVGAISWNDDSANLYYNDLYFSGSDNQLKYRVDSETLIQVNPIGGPVAPYFFTEINGDFVLLQLNTDTTQWYNRGNGTASPWNTAGYTGGGSLIPYVYSAITKSYGTTLNVKSMSDTFGGINILPYEWYYSQADWGVEMIKWAVSDDGHPMIIHFGEAPQDGSGFHRGFCTHNYFNTRDEIYNFIAGGGIKFKTDKVYKPIIQDGWVTGYSDDMSTPSELDEWHGSTIHTVSPTPPTPPIPPTPSSDWDVDPETYGWSGGEVSGMVKYYLLTSGEMGLLQSAIASNANWTIDYLNCVVSCFAVPNSGIFFDAPIPTTVKFVLDNATQWDTGVSCSRIQGTKNKSGGTIEIPRLTNTFYDFEPYSDYSVYIPFCGRVPIKGNVCLDREIKVTYYPDVPTCSLTAVISCGGATIAIAKGSFGTMTPVTSNGSDRKTAAVIGDVAPIITGIGTGIVGVALGNPLIVGAGAAQALGGIMGGVKETVQSYAYSVGSSGDSSFFGAGNRCYYYANYPLIDDVVNDPMFGHSVGYLCNTVGKLSNFVGFTMCANPHVTFSASAEEREEIERLLSMGVIL